MARVMELRDFVRFFFGIIKSMGAFSQALTPDSRQAFEAEASKYKLVSYDFSNHRQFVNETMLSRAVESFDLYVLLILREIFEAKPEILKSEGSIDIATVIDLKSFDSVVTFLTERKIHELSYKSLDDLQKYIHSRTGLALFRTDAAFDAALLASEVRNLIAHNDCRVNDIFDRRLKGLKRPLDDLPISKAGKFIIEDEWLRQVSYTLDAAVFDFDVAASDKFGLQTMNPKTSFTFR
ncbi:hypothetical protein IQ17_04082 [Bradyrhizobium daqingense]|uniref:Uncharacterized protein n=2 Tax=Bradyrhizobium daqingense TaxID=993502 RepID=A0A562L482_9BRAD|nr:hypothetical protein IQ17_04082 [Bradyrhizobium daqingense]